MPEEGKITREKKKVSGETKAPRWGKVPGEGKRKVPR